MGERKLISPTDGSWGWVLKRSVNLRDGAAARSNAQAFPDHLSVVEWYLIRPASPRNNVRSRRVWIVMSPPCSERALDGNIPSKEYRPWSTGATSDAEAGSQRW